ncbi:putative Nephrin-like 27 [Homarus americanus]|uniref:Putative Nephrin-like 27 n=1 Tax=Homarus americanus TaxID=6706 RepID=A0A8J5K1I3_HOMAM|nr:putative Nephrin-like 27 [Homarus americanus]
MYCKPESPSNCTVGGRSRTSVRVEGLQVDGKYQLVIRAVNEKGSSGATHLIVSSIGTNGSIYQLHGLVASLHYCGTFALKQSGGQPTLADSKHSDNSDGPLEAEVRDGGQTNVVNEGTANDFDVSSFDALVLPSFIVGVLGVGSGLVLIVILLLLFITFRRRRRTPRAHPLSESLQQTEVETVEHHHSRGASKSPKCSHESPVLMTPEHDVICLERDMQAESESDADPDVIPLQEASYRGYEVPPAATLLPSDRYKYAPVPAHLPNIINPHPPIQPCPSQYSSMLGVTQAAPPLTTGQPGGRDLPDPSCLGPHHHHHHYTYLHQQARSSTLPRRTNVNPNSASLCSYTPTLSPHQFPCSEGEGSFPPPPPEYLDCERKRVTFSRHASYEEDTPSTPLLKKGESSV